jgi:putative DNA primase/helicase
MIELTLLTKKGGPLSKRIALGFDDKIRSDGSACLMAKGTARRLTVPDLGALAACFEHMKSTQAIALGALRDGIPDTATITTKQALNGHSVANDVIARTAENILYRPGQPAFALFDSDTKGMPPTIEAKIAAEGGFDATLASVLPALRDVGRLSRASTSAGLYRGDTGERLLGSNGQHTYVQVTDGTDVGRFLRALHGRCWLAGYGWLMIGRAGQLLERSLIDRMVDGAERLVFEGAPVLAKPLLQDAEIRRPRVVEGPALDSRAACPDLTPAELATLAELIRAEELSLAPEAEVARGVYVRDYAERMGISEAEARRIVESKCRGVLDPIEVLLFDDPKLAGATVADVLADPDRYVGKSMADPIEGLEYGRGKAMLLRGLDGLLRINSFAHGGVTYELPAVPPEPPDDWPEPPPPDSETSRGQPGLGGGVELTEDGIATAFANLHRNSLQFCHHTGWYFWTGARWKREESKLAFSWARSLCRNLKLLARGTATAAEFAAMAKAATYAAVETIAKADRAFAVTSEVWDTHPMLLVTGPDTFNLSSTSLAQYPARQEDRITMQTAVAPADSPDCEKWLSFLDQITQSSQELINFLQRWCGYCLTGSTREHAFLILWGPGGNGKSVFADTIKGIMGEYAATAAVSTFTAQRGERHSTDIAVLRGVRLVVCNEVEEGEEWAEALVKKLTGGGTVRARLMRKDSFEYEPQYKLMPVVNHIPKLRHVDDAMTRRMLVVPFTFKPEKPNLMLFDEMRAEWPGILRWMIEGCLAWQKIGLNPPEAVRARTAEYFDQQDRFSAWASDRCIRDHTLTSRPAALLTNFNEWAAENGEKPANRHEFKGWVDQQRDLKTVELHGSRTVRGIGLAAPAGSYRDKRSGG